MTEQRRTALRDLQKLDKRIEKAKRDVSAFDPLFAEVEEPALILESEVGTTRSRLQEMKLAERRLELATEEKSERVKRLEERLGSVRNLREEAAVSAELEMVRRALQSDEQEALTLIDQIRKLDERLTELEEAFAEAQELVGPRLEELVEKRSVAQERLAELESEREKFAQEMDPTELKLYEGIRGGGRSVAVAPLTEDGACGNCFGMVPLQVQNEIRHGTDLIRCEGCGVILAAPEPGDEEPDEDEEDAPEAVSAADAGDADDEGAETPAEEAEGEDDDAGDAPVPVAADEDAGDDAEAPAAMDEPADETAAEGDEGSAEAAEEEPAEPVKPEPVRAVAGAVEPDDGEEEGEEKDPE